MEEVDSEKLLRAKQLAQLVQGCMSIEMLGDVMLFAFKILTNPHGGVFGAEYADAVKGARMPVVNVMLREAPAKKESEEVVN